MGKMFLPADQPLSSCNQTECGSCGLEKDLACHFNGKHLFLFFLLMAPSFLFGGKMILEYSHICFYIWLVMIPAYFGFIEIWAMCSHCPHYGEPSLKSLKCWANYGAPKLWKYKPGPMSLIEKIVFIGGLIIIFLMPLVIIILMGQIFNSIFYLLLVIAAFSMLKSFYCTKCMNFACVLNKTPEDIKDTFFKYNPEIAKVWGKEIK